MAGKVIDLAKVHVDYVRVTGAERDDGFLEDGHREALPPGAKN